VGVDPLSADTLATACAWWLAGLFAWAAAAKLTHQGLTSDAFSALDLRHPTVLARIVPLIELGVAVGLIIAPLVGGSLAFAVLVVFSQVLWTATRRGTTAPCACFGGVTERPIAWPDLVRNAGLMVVALLATAGEPLSFPGLVSLGLVGLGLALGATAVAALRRVAG
jgi:hypothetical protein